MKKKLLFIAFVLFVSFSYAQKVIIKKGIISVDKKEYLKYDDEFENISLMTLDGKEFAIIKQYSFEKARKKNPNNPEDWRYGDTVTVNYFVISFLDFDLEYETDLNLKKIYTAFFKYNLVENGKVSQENAKIIGAKISKEISGEIPIVLIRN